MFNGVVTGEIFPTVGRNQNAKGTGQIQRKEDSTSRGPAENIQSNDDDAECQLIVTMATTSESDDAYVNMSTTALTIIIMYYIWITETLSNSIRQ